MKFGVTSYIIFRLPMLHLMSTTCSIKLQMEGIISKKIITYTSDRFFYGVSFGTAWLFRMLELTPPSFGTAAIFDSVFPPHFAQIQQADATIGNAGFSIFERCNADPFCAGAFALEFAGFSPTDVLKRTFNELSLKTGNAFECAKKIGFELEVNGLKSALGSVLFSYYTRMLAPPLIFRLNRCNSNDIQVLNLSISS